MKPTLTLTDLFINEDNNRFNIELVGTIDRKLIKMVSRPIPLEGTTLEIKNGIFLNTLNGLTLQAALSIQNAGVEFFFPAGMNLIEKLSLFTLKQTASFNNGMLGAGLEDNVIIAAL